MFEFVVISSLFLIYTKVYESSINIGLLHEHLHNIERLLEEIGE